MANYDDYDASSYREGFGARLAGKDATDVPYRKMTNKWFNWLDGWKDQDHHLTGRDTALESIGWFGRTEARNE